MPTFDWLEPEYEPRTRLAGAVWKRGRTRTGTGHTYPRHKSEYVRRYGHPFLTTGPSTYKRERQD